MELVNNVFLDKQEETGGWNEAKIRGRGENKMEQALRTEIEEILDRRMLGVARNFDCPVCERLTLVYNIYVSGTEVYCYICGHTFQKSEPQWIEVPERKQV